MVVIVVVVMGGRIRVGTMAELRWRIVSAPNPAEEAMGVNEVGGTADPRQPSSQEGQGMGGTLSKVVIRIELGGCG